MLCYGCMNSGQVLIFIHERPLPNEEILEISWFTDLSGAGPGEKYHQKINRNPACLLMLDSLEQFN